MPVTYGGEKADLSIVRDLTERRRAEAERDAATKDQAVTRDLVRRMLRESSGLSRGPSMRALGRRLAQDVPAESLRGFLHAFESMGGGRFVVESEAQGRYVVRGSDLLERREGATQPTCELPLGYLEGAITRLVGAGALGTETRCQSLGHGACVFVVQARATPVVPRPTVPRALGKA
jgi:predicted hydrocarbon binding protein